MKWKKFKQPKQTSSLRIRKEFSIVSTGAASRFDSSCKIHCWTKWYCLVNNFVMFEKESLLKYENPLKSFSCTMVFWWTCQNKFISVKNYSKMLFNFARFFAVQRFWLGFSSPWVLKNSPITAKREICTVTLIYGLPAPKEAVLYIAMWNDNETATIRYIIQS